MKDKVGKKVNKKTHGTRLELKQLFIDRNDASVPLTIGEKTKIGAMKEKVVAAFPPGSNLVEEFETTKMLGD
jgi:hypothetical protein